MGGVGVLRFRQVGAQLFRVAAKIVQERVTPGTDTILAPERRVKRRPRGHKCNANAA